jgi:polyferredoxin
MNVKSIWSLVEESGMPGQLPRSGLPKFKVKSARRIAQIASLLLSVPLFYFLAVFDLFSLIVAILMAALVSSIVVGRAFCSWVCPFGTLYEFSRLGFNCQRLRPWCRFGCPYAFIMGIMNRFSVMMVRRNDAECTQCGICDTCCPVGLVDLGSSYRDFTGNPSRRYACIRCLTCVASCPQGALRLTCAGYICNG